MQIEKSKNIINSMDPFHRVGISLVLTIITYFFVRKISYNGLMIGTMLWDVFTLSYVILSWVVFLTSPVHQMKENAAKEDGGRFFVFLVIVISSFASMITVTMLIVSKDTANIDKNIYLPVIVSGILLSWIMVHSTFVFHYARLYYDTDDESGKIKGGLDFPSCENPDYIDFAYFSFIIGMTFQVSDVQISSRSMRRKALVHSLLAFALNTFVVALTINLIAGLKS